MSFTFDSTNQRYEAPGLTVSRVSLTLTNNPLWCSYSDGKPSHWDALFKYEFSCLANGRSESTRLNSSHSAKSRMPSSA